MNLFIEKRQYFVLPQNGFTTLNEILLTIFKYHHQSFESINETENIINAIQKELNNIIKFLDKSKDKAAFEL